MEHHHEHCGCGCGHDHSHEHHHEHHSEHAHHQGELTSAQAAFRHELEHHHYLPLARFLMESTAEDDFSSVALAPVYLLSPQDTMEQVKEMGALLLDLERRGWITLDYGYALEGYSYEEYRTSELYAYFCRTVEEAKGRPGFLGDTPVLELGSIALAEE